MAPPVLYTYFRSSCSWRVRIVLNLKGVEYEPRPVNLLKGEQKGSEYFGPVSSMPMVPTLVVGEHHLCQSLAIMEYLEEVYPNVPTLPKDPFVRAKVREIVDIICVDTQPVQNLRILQYVGDDKKMEHAKYWITVSFEALEKLLEKTAGKYCVGDTVTMADVCLVPQVYNARRFNVDMSRFPTIARIDAELASIQAFKDAHPTAQPDCPADLK
eukprot:comp21177_c0_seq1/m.28713 comp21177_c0_seq1/g.28713  ORF comp21177_c0_seq1/g.28713 comp21177_c0_seq1/m.28713 type:complete len:213 (-) comp21177_c0_seq1:460-1098(-)